MPFVAQTIDSVLSQEYGNLEYIVVDGGSVDGTVEIIKSKQSKISHWISEKDAGIADAFNKGLAMSSGEYVLFLNADDALAGSGIVTEIANEVVKNDFPTIVYGDCAYLDRDSGRMLRRLQVPLSRAGLLRGKMPPHPSMFARRSYFERYGGFDLNFKIAMDFDWLLRGAMNERIIHVPLLVTNMRSGGVSALDRNAVVTEIIAALRKNGYITSAWDTLSVSAYFHFRSSIRKTLDALGIYGIATRLRSK
jgi:glycosyltransferase involved in cell wall biosynthesis